MEFRLPSILYSRIPLVCEVDIRVLPRQQLGRFEKKLFDLWVTLNKRGKQLLISTIEMNTKRSMSIFYLLLDSPVIEANFLMVRSAVNNHLINDYSLL